MEVWEGVGGGMVEVLKGYMEVWLEVWVEVCEG